MNSNVIKCLKDVAGIAFKPLVLPSVFIIFRNINQYHNKTLPFQSSIAASIGNIKSIVGVQCNILTILFDTYRQTSTIVRTLVGYKVVDHSEVVGASPVGAAPTISSFSTLHLDSMDWANTTARRDEKHLIFFGVGGVGWGGVGVGVGGGGGGGAVWCASYQRFDGNSNYCNKHVNRPSFSTSF